MKIMTLKNSYLAHMIVLGSMYNIYVEPFLGAVSIAPYLLKQLLISITYSKLKQNYQDGGVGE